MTILAPPPQQARPSFLVLAALVGAILTLPIACGGSSAAFGPSYIDNVQEQVHAVVRRAEESKRAESATIALGASPSTVYAYDLVGHRVLWQHALQPTSAPLLTPANAVVERAGSVIGYDARTGAESFEIDRDGLSLLGADGEGDTTVLTLGSGQGTRARAEVLLVRNGSVRWRRPIPGLGGIPALAGTNVLVPWNTQYLTALDASNGDEVARIRVRDGVISHVVRAPSATFVASFAGLSPLSDALVSGSLKRAGILALPDGELPGRPALFPDAHTQTRRPKVDGAEHRIGLAFTPELAGGHARFEGRVIYAFFYRCITALDPATLAVRWIRVVDKDIVGARALAGGVLIGDERGTIRFLDASSGAVRGHGAPGIATTVMRLPGGGVPERASGRTLGDDELRTQLMAAIRDPDARLSPARVFAVQQLARLPEARATADLVALCDEDELSPPVRERACVELKQRPNGSEAILATLARHAGYLEGTKSPQVGALATAAASVKLTAAVPLLLQHLADPNTRSSDLPELITALADLGDRSAAPALAEFVRLYHADPIDAPLVKALTLIPGALVKLRASKTVPVLRGIATDELGIYPVRQQARAAAEGLKEPPPPEPASVAENKEAPTPTAPATPQKQPDEPDESTAPTTLPPRLTMEMLEAALEPAQRSLTACLTKPGSAAIQARVVLVISDGRAQMVSVVPSEVQACIEPIIRGQSFPVTAARTPERLIYTLRRPGS